MSAQIENASDGGEVDTTMEGVADEHPVTHPFQAAMEDQEIGGWDEEEVDGEPQSADMEVEAESVGFGLLLAQFLCSTPEFSR